MNTILIAFLIFVIIMAIYLAVLFYNPSYIIRKSSPLNILNEKSPSSSVQYTIPVTELDNPGSARYYYEMWMFIHSNSPIETENVIFNRGTNFVVTLKSSTLNVYVNYGKTTAKVSTSGILTNTGDSPLTLLTSISNFPFQKWSQLVISVDGLSVDMYLDGKFVNNVKSTNVISVNVEDPITYGNQYTIGSITKFRRPAIGVNPQDVWASYILGSGQNNSVSDYHLNVQLTKNKNIRTDQRLF